MKRDNNEEPLKAVIDRLLKLYQLDDGYTQMEVEKHWKEMVGPVIAKYTDEIELKKGVLTIRINSAPLRQELSFGKEKIASMINTKIGRAIIQRVEIR